MATKPKSSRSKTPSKTKPKLKTKRTIARKASEKSRTKTRSKMDSNTLRLNKPLKVTAQISSDNHGRLTTRTDPIEDSIKSENPERHMLATSSFSIEVDGRSKSAYPSEEAARKAALELKKKYPHIRVAVTNDKDRTRTVIELS